MLVLWWSVLQPDLAKSWQRGTSLLFIRYWQTWLSLFYITSWFFFLFQKSLQEEIEVLESRVESIQRVLSDLKVQLYAKFGNNINLEAEDS